MVHGKTMKEELAARDPYTDTNIIKTVKEPLLPTGGIVILKGNLCPDGAVIKVSACMKNICCSIAVRPWCSTASRNITSDRR